MFDSDLGTFELIKQSCNNLKQLHFYPGNILRILLKNDLLKFDLIYSSGLFDYFDLDKSVRLARKLWENVKPGGSLIITNAHPDNPTRFWMEYVSEWYLEYKTDQEMMLIAKDLNNVDRISLEIDPYNVYQYLIITKTLC